MQLNVQIRGNIHPVYVAHMIQHWAPVQTQGLSISKYAFVPGVNAEFTNPAWSFKFSNVFSEINLILSIDFRG